MVNDPPPGSTVSAKRLGGVAVVYASDYLNKLSGERIERECRQQLAAGCRALILDFRNTGLVNSIGVSILLGVIDRAERANALLIFASVNQQAAQLFDLLGLTSHVNIAADEQAALSVLSAFNLSDTIAANN